MVGFRRSSITVEAAVDLSEALGELRTEELVEEIRSRGVEGTTHLESVRTAIAQIRRGDTLDAITTLEREFWPKWSSVHQSEVEFWAAKPIAEIVAAIANDNTKEAALGAVA